MNLPGFVMLEGDFLVAVWDAVWKCASCPAAHGRHFILVRRADEHVVWEITSDGAPRIFGFAKKPGSDDAAFALVDAQVDRHVGEAGNGKKRSARIDSDDILALGKRLEVEHLGELEVLSVHQVPLWPMAEDDVAREGFPGRTAEWFVDHFAKAMKCDRNAWVTRIEFRKVSP